MKKKPKVGILFGGKSTEHEVSIRSARSIFSAIDTKKYAPVLIGITKRGVWLDTEDSKKLLDGKAVNKKGNPFPNLHGLKIDVAFPVLHGSFGEDGTMQGFLKLAGIPFVGPSVLGSAIGMDKDVAKRLLREAGIDVAESMMLGTDEKLTASFTAVRRKLGMPVFVKPANAGSSVGVSKVRNETEFRAALDHAFKYDTKVLVEKAIVGRELEVSVLGNTNPQASVVGEVIPAGDFYSYDAKYADNSGSTTAIPAKLTSRESEAIRKIAVSAYRSLCLEGMARVDFFLSEGGRVLVNEVNTIPGFTSISMYPKLWEASGLPYPRLVSTLIDLALERHLSETDLQKSL